MRRAGLPVVVPRAAAAARLHAAIAAVKRVGPGAPAVLAAFGETALAFGPGATLLMACTELPLVHDAAMRAPRWARAFEEARLAFVDASALLAGALARRGLGLPPPEGEDGGGAQQQQQRPQEAATTTGPSFLKKVE